jgi:hypothetical protein
MNVRRWMLALTICFATGFALLQGGTHIGSQLGDDEAANVWGGQYCPTFVHVATDVACTTGAPDTCQLNAAQTGCIGSCGFQCTPVNSWFGGGIVRGQQSDQNTCPTEVEAGCDFIQPQNDPPSCICNPFNPQAVGCYPAFYSVDDCDP